MNMEAFKDQTAHHCNLFVSLLFARVWHW